MPISVQRIFISPGHNFFGHYGRPPGAFETLEVPRVECVAGQGLRGDRFFGFKENYKGQVTFLCAEVFEQVCEAIGRPDRSPACARRNVITRGVDLNSLVGREFELQDIRFEGVCECAPCEWMNLAIGPGAEAALRGRGGLRARILSSGLLRAGCGRLPPA